MSTFNPGMAQFVVDYSIIDPYHTIQEIHYDTDLGVVNGGTFKLSVEGHQTGTINWNASPATGASSVQAKLEALTNVGTGGVTVTGSPGAWICDFSVAFGGARIDVMIADTSLLTASSGVAALAICGGGSMPNRPGLLLIDSSRRDIPGAGSGPGRRLYFGFYQFGTAIQCCGANTDGSPNYSDTATPFEFHVASGQVSIRGVHNAPSFPGTEVRKPMDLNGLYTMYFNHPDLVSSNANMLGPMLVGIDNSDPLTICVMDSEYPQKPTPKMERSGLRIVHGGIVEVGGLVHYAINGGTPKDTKLRVLSGNHDSGSATLAFGDWFQAGSGARDLWMIIQDCYATHDFPLIIQDFNRNNAIWMTSGLMNIRRNKVTIGDDNFTNNYPAPLTITGDGTNCQKWQNSSLTEIAAIDNAGTLQLASKVTKYNGITTVSGGVPSEVVTVDSTNQTAAISATNLYLVPSTGAGMYRISWVASVTQAATTSSVLGGTNGFQILYTDANDSVGKTTDPAMKVTSSANTTSTSISGTAIVFAKASTYIQYAFDYTSSGGTAMQYNLHMKVEAL